VSESKTPAVNQLEEISIRSLGVIESAQIEFGPGLTVLTGETGAGKTMVLTALGLVLGGKGDADLVRTGSERTVVSSRFTVTPQISEAILDLGGDIEGSELLLTRTIGAEGKSRITIGGALSTTSKVAGFAEGLIEIHGQSTNLRLAKPAVQRELLDAFVGAESELGSYQESFDEYRSLAERIALLQKESAQKDAQIAELKAFVDEFSKILPKSGEDREIEDEINRLGSVEELHNVITTALNQIEDEERGIISSLNLARRTLESIKGKDSTLDRAIDKYSTVLFDLADSTGDLLSYLGRLEANPARFDALQQRKAGINSLIKKFGIGSDREVAFEELITRFEFSQERIADLVGGDARIIELERELGTIFMSLKKAAKVLTAKRNSGADKLSKLTTSEMQKLSMPNSELICEINTASGEKFSEYSSTGLDEIALLFAGHAGANPLPLSKVASGGETSRVMLALSVVIAESSPMGTYIFDEVDAGVGGAAAVEVGRRLKALSKIAQVIVVTHLAQVAVWADHHLLVQKDQSGSVSSSDVLMLDDAARKVEIARMLSGQAQSETAQEHAAELLELVRKSTLAS
jgi:DNA repair protein RecN (Recombination protein N)